MTRTTSFSLTVNAPPVGSILVKRVGSDGYVASAPVGTVARIDLGAANSANPATFTPIVEGYHTVDATNVVGYTTTAGICAFVTGGVECTVSTFNIILACNGNPYCSIPSVQVSAGYTTKVVYQYIAAPLAIGVRALPATYIPGVGFTVSIALTPPSNVNTVIVTETPPAGWTISSPSTGGSIDALHNQVKWFFSDNLARTLTYVITPPTSATGIKTFAGIVGMIDSVTFDQTTVDIVGQTTISN